MLQIPLFLLEKGFAQGKGDLQPGRASGMKGKLRKGFIPTLFSTLFGISGGDWDLVGPQNQLLFPRSVGKSSRNNPVIPNIGKNQELSRINSSNIDGSQGIINNRNLPQSWDPKISSFFPIL